MTSKYDALSCCICDTTSPTSSYGFEKPQPSQQSQPSQPPQLSQPANNVKIPYLELNIKEILENSILGKDLLKKYFTTNILNNSEQTTLVRLIVDYFALADIKMDPKIMSAVADEITKIFPTEIASTYYLARNKKRNPSGKLYDRYFNTVYKRKNLNFPNPKKMKISNESISDINNETDEDSQDKSEYEHKKNWLALNNPSDIKSLWAETSSFRIKERKSFKEILEDWPRYKDPKGFDLIEIDFGTMYPGKGRMMFEAIDNFLEKLLYIFPDFVKDKSHLERIHKITLNISQDTKMYHLFHLLHAIILPPRINKSKKPSISEAQEDMIYHIVNFNKFKQIQEELMEYAANEGISVEPKVFVVGESIDMLEEFVVYIDGITYKVASLLQAVDLVIKMCFVFNLDYSFRSKYVWGFVQEAIYDIPFKEEVPKVKNILNLAKILLRFQKLN